MPSQIHTFSERVIIDIDDQPKKSREKIHQIGEEIKLRIAEYRFNDLYTEFSQIDTELFSLILRIIAHDKIYGHLETIEERKGSLNNICRSVCCLSDRARHDNETERIKEKYSIEERSIWRDIEFLHKGVVFDVHGKVRRSFEIPDLLIKRIFEEDIPQLTEIVVTELDCGISAEKKEEVKNKYKDSSLLRNIYLRHCLKPVDK
jgi:hypothetical protein